MESVSQLVGCPLKTASGPISDRLGKGTVFLAANQPIPVVEELKQMDIDSLPPIQALMKLKELKDKIQ